MTLNTTTTYYTIIITTTTTVAVEIGDVVCAAECELIVAELIRSGPFNPCRPHNGLLTTAKVTASYHCSFRVAVLIRRTRVSIIVHYYYYYYFVTINSTTAVTDNGIREPSLTL